ncbi:hypothetical protein M2322_002688 [Rhodoblastus acidophilus]|uniref:hypothetical protein n=1 Tax=Rhodoblastus acidophilus TaxID=1074 RepID=UPI002224F000|nr:hypothetical protein [Rhodoblastus acidophilus]MCW2317134.1 hypothetical protein [Rhodoblastus acidophilus]
MGNENAPRFEAEIQTDDATSADFGMTGKALSGTSTTNNDAVSTEVALDGSKASPQGQLAKSAAEELEDEGKVGGEGRPTKKDAEETAEVLEGELGEWKTGDPEIQDKFDGHYFKEGQLNQEALSKEFWTNFEKAGADKAGLNDATYAYLKDTLGVSKEFVKDVEKALVAQANAANETFYKSVGGKDRFEAAVKWGREGGYTPAQRERFNKARAEGGEAFQDAVEALMARYTKVNPGESQQQARRGPPRSERRSSPARSVTSGASGGGGAGGDAAGVDAFKTHEDYQVAWQDGLRQQRNARTPAEKRAAKDHLDTLRAKARRSRFQ